MNMMRQAKTGIVLKAQAFGKKNFMWRACNNSIPTKLNLLRRAISIDPQCDRCKNEAESTLHALWLCNDLDLVWTSSTEWNFRSTR